MKEGPIVVVPAKLADGLEDSRPNILDYPLWIVVEFLAIELSDCEWLHCDQSHFEVFLDGLVQRG